MSESVKMLSERLEEIADDLRRHAATDEENMREIKEDLRIIRKVLTDGNGSPSLVVQVTRNGERIEAIEPKVEKLVRIADDGKFDKKSRGAIVVAILALTGAIAVPILQHLLT